MKVNTLFEQEETDDEIIELGRFVRSLLNSRGQSAFIKAIDYIRDNPDLDSELAAVALEALGRNKLEDYYKYLKRQNPNISNYF